MTGRLHVHITCPHIHIRIRFVSDKYGSMSNSQLFSLFLTIVFILSITYEIPIYVNPILCHNFKGFKRFSLSFFYRNSSYCQQFYPPEQTSGKALLANDWETMSDDDTTFRKTCVLLHRDGNISSNIRFPLSDTIKIFLNVLYSLLAMP